MWPFVVPMARTPRSPNFGKHNFGCADLVHRFGAQEGDSIVATAGPPLIISHMHIYAMYTRFAQPIRDTVPMTNFKRRQCLVFQPDFDFDDVYTLLYKFENNVATALDACEFVLQCGCGACARPHACNPPYPSLLSLASTSGCCSIHSAALYLSASFRPPLPSACLYLPLSCPTSALPLLSSADLPLLVLCHLLLPLSLPS